MRALRASDGLRGRARSRRLDRSLATATSLLTEAVLRVSLVVVDRPSAGASSHLQTPAEFVASLSTVTADAGLLPRNRTVPPTHLPHRGPVGNASDVHEGAPKQAWRGLQIAVFSMALGFPLAGGFSVSNVGQVLSLALLLSAARLMRLSDMIVVCFLSASMVASATAGQVLLNVEPKYAQIAFFSLGILQIAIVVRMAPLADRDWRDLLRVPVNAAAAVLLIAAAIDYTRAREATWLTLFFQDKSHAAVVAYCLAFLVLSVNKSVARFALAGAVYGASIATASRLVALGAPMLMLAALFEYQRSRRQATGAVGVYVHHLVALTIPVALYQLWRSDIAQALTERLSYVGNSTDASLFSHFALIGAAWELKWTSATQVFLGAGPGGFAQATRAEGISLSDIASHDPGAIEAIYSGFAPIHSTNVSILAEFPIWFFVAFVWLWFRVLVGLIRRREYVLLLMGVGLLTVTSFYSSHNEYFYFVLLSILCLVAFAEDRSPTQKTFETAATTSDRSFEA